MDESDQRYNIGKHAKIMKPERYIRVPAVAVRRMGWAADQRVNVILDEKNAEIILSIAECEYFKCLGCMKEKPVSDKSRGSSIYCTECHRIISNARRTKYRLHHPQNYNCEKRFLKGLRDGKIKRGPCSVCGTDLNVEGHHTDYKKPLEVVWLCRQHHLEIHNGKGK
jgi:hypothetical protein